MTLERYVVDKKEEIRALKVEHRELHVPDTKRFILAVLGPRRAGKTYFLYDNILNKKSLRDDDFIFVNFEDVALHGATSKDILKAVNLHAEIYGKEPEFLFFDEVQVVEGWDSAIFTLFEKKKYSIFLSGSSSKLLSKEIASKLRGRSLKFALLPFSFREFLKVKGIDAIEKPISTKKENMVKNALRRYIQRGGFPDVVFEPKIAGSFFRDYVDVVLFRDVVERHGIKNLFVIRFLINAVLSSVSKEFSVHRAFKALKSQGVKVSKKTLYSYSLLLEDVFFCFFLKRFADSMRSSELSVPKVYLCDTGMAKTLSGSKDSIGRLMENTVFLELFRQSNQNPLAELFYWKDSLGNEVDFVVRERNRVKQLLQVSFFSERRELKQRETKALLKASKELKCNNLLVVTWDYESKEKINGKTITFTPLWKWLLEN